MSAQRISYVFDQKKSSEIRWLPLARCFVLFCKWSREVSFKRNPVCNTSRSPMSSPSFAKEQPSGATLPDRTRTEKQGFGHPELGTASPWFSVREDQAIKQYVVLYMYSTCRWKCGVYIFGQKRTYTIRPHNLSTLSPAPKMDFPLFFQKEWDSIKDNWRLEVKYSVE